MKINYLVALVIALVLNLQGCETTKGSKDGLKNFGQGVKNTENWVKEHLW